MEVYTSDSSDSDSRDQKTLNYVRFQMTTECLEDTILNLYKTDTAYGDIESMLLNNNFLKTIPLSLSKFHNLHILDLSSNGLTTLPDFMFQCPLTTLIVKNNFLTNDSLPKSLVSKTGGHQLREINLSGNLFTHFPDHVLELRGLKYLYLGGNKITTISKDIGKLQRFVFFFNYIAQFNLKKKSYIKFLLLFYCLLYKMIRTM